MFAVLGDIIYRGDVIKSDTYSSTFNIRRISKYIEVWNTDIYDDYSLAVEKRDKNIKDNNMGIVVNGIKR